LRFVIATTQDSTLLAWAVQEKKFVEAQLHRLEDEIHQAEVAVQKTEPISGATTPKPREGEARIKAEAAQVRLLKLRQQHDKQWLSH
jgi:hypothetical protein